MRYRLSEKADQDLQDIFVEGILTFGSFQALKYQDSFTRTFDLLAYMPALGRTSEREHTNERRFPHGSHVIYYRIDAGEVIIESIEHSSTIRSIWGEF